YEPSTGHWRAGAGGGRRHRRTEASVALRLGGPSPRLIAVLTVVIASGLQARGERQRPPRLGVAAEQLQAPAQAEKREVVRRRPVHDRLELRRRLLVALGSEQRPAPRLPDRGLL